MNWQDADKWEDLDRVEGVMAWQSGDQFRITDGHLRTTFEDRWRFSVITQWRLARGEEEKRQQEKDRRQLYADATLEARPWPLLN